MEPWSLRCEDDEEALGLALVLERAGLEVRCVPEEHGMCVEVPARQREQAESLSSRLRVHYVRKVDAERRSALARRQRKSLVALASGTLLLALVGLGLLLRFSL